MFHARFDVKGKEKKVKNNLFFVSAYSSVLAEVYRERAHNLVENDIRYKEYADFIKFIGEGERPVEDMYNRSTYLYVEMGQYKFPIF